MPRSIDSRRTPVRTPWQRIATGWGGVVLLGGVLTFGTAGCRREQTWNLAPVEGTVTRAGRPLAGIQVIFLADVQAGTSGPRAAGITDDAGHYRLRTDNGDEGAVVGKHRVCLVDWRARSETPPEKGRVPPSYGSFRETRLRADIHSGAQTFDINMP